ncbi:unnamed protein product [Caenorhabditis angaria]|uniref:Galactokinase n=1 Tax=Caenorhabditis angaria TaxID=860376 RepID=A0A9P1I8E7_9PELO|nr:unnamed protein product [Caenorhabditis angaria]
MNEKNMIIEKFEDLYGIKPQVFIRCPGRVNLIGEHIDYHGYGVFPMAISASTVILAAKNEKNVLEFANVDPKYSPWKSELPCEWSGSSSPKWFDYILCGWKGILDYGGFEQFGMSFLVTGEIPPSSGLSSSSSLVCASALSTLSLLVESPFDFISKEDFAHLCATSEPLIGTLSGGMDQAAEVLAVEGSALKIDFNPLKSKNIQLPDQSIFVVAHSNTELNKGATSHYNERVIEGRIVGEILKKHLKIQTNKMLEIIENVLPTEVNKEEAEKLIGADKLELCLNHNTQHLASFKLLSRARHVFSEAKRVEDFEIACESKNIEEMGKLMNESQKSCALDYECSCDELDDLCSKYISNGAIGARLTGAGWGGCAVALFSSTTSSSKLDKLEPLFVSKPAGGIEFEKLT